MGLVKRSIRTAIVLKKDTVQENDGREDSSKAPSRWRAIQTRALSKRALTLATGLLFLSRLMDCILHHRKNGRGSLTFNRFHPKPLVVQSQTTINVTRLTSEADPPHLITERTNKHWISHEVWGYHSIEKVPESCVAEAEWMNDTHPSCNLFHEIDMRDFFFNKKRKAVKVNGRRHRRKLAYIGGGGFRNAFMFHEHDGKRRVLKTLLYDEDQDFGPRNVERMRSDAIISEQLSASPYIADIYGYCAQSSLVDYSDEDDMLYLFSQEEKPTKDELFQIAHDVAQSVADAHHFNKEGRATIVHMDIKPNQWIYLDGMYKLNDFNLARFLSWDPVKKKNCHYASGYSEGRVSRCRVLFNLASPEFNKNI